MVGIGELALHYIQQKYEIRHEIMEKETQAQFVDMPSEVIRAMGMMIIWILFHCKFYAG